MNDAPPQAGGQVGKLGKTEHFMVLRGLFFSLLTKKIGKPNFVIFVVFLVALGL